VNEDRAVPDCEVRISAGPEPNVVEEAMDVSQGKLALGFRTGGVTCWEQEYPALLLCNAIYGGTSLSKLFMNVREKLSLCYYASSVLEKQKGLLLVSSGIEFEQYHTARDEILAQLDAIRRGEMEEWELEGGRRTLIGSCLSALDDQSRQEEYWLTQAVAGLEETPEEMAARLETVTPEQVSAAAQKLQLDTIYFLKGKEG
jgi:predicted Zn-dependent peptidase